MAVQSAVLKPKLGCSEFEVIYRQCSVFSCGYYLKSYAYLILSGERSSVRKEYAWMTERSTEEVQCSFMEDIYLGGMELREASTC